MARNQAAPRINWHERHRRPRGANLLRTARQNVLGGVGLAIVLLMVLTAIFAPYISSYDPLAQSYAPFVKPGSEHWFGTDRYGRDIFARVVYGSRVSLQVGLGSVALGGAVGIVLGLVSGYFAGKIDTLIQSIVNIMLAFPTLVLALAIVTVLGASLANVIIAIAISIVPGLSRVVRGAVIGVKENDFILACHAVGASQIRIIARHILPNIAAPIIVILTAVIALAILAEAGLSYLGLGVPPPTPSWGQDLSGTARDYFTYAPWLAIFPGVAISLAVFGFNLLGDAIRDVMDPRLRRRA